MSDGTVRRLVPKTGPGSPAAEVAARVLADLDNLVAAMGEAYRREIPEYAAMSPAQMTEEVLPTSRRAVTSFFDAYLAGRPVEPKVVRAFEASGRSRLHMGVPLESVLHAYRIAGRVTWGAVVEAIHPGDEHLLATLAARWIDFIDELSSVVARSYVQASNERLRHLDARRRELIEALLTATDPGEVAAVSLRFSTVLATAYVPVLLCGGDVVAHVDAVLAAAPARTLGGHRGDRVLLLVPDTFGGVGPLRTAAGDVLIAWGRPAAPGRDLLAEVRHVEGLAVAALAEGHATGAFGPEDLLVEQLLLGNERVAGVLRRRVHDALDARDPGGLLVATLRAYLATGSVPETARREVVHPNTVAYRLGRIRELTGLDPRVPVDAVLLVLGLGLEGKSR